MEGRNPQKKTRSYGGAPRNSRTHQNSPSPSSAARPQYKERVKSAPLGDPQIEERQKTSQPTSAGKTTREIQTSEPDTLSAPISKESAVHARHGGSNGHVEMP